MAHWDEAEARVTPAAAGALPEDGAVGLGRAGGTVPPPGRDAGPPDGRSVSDMTTVRLRARRAGWARTV